MDIILIVNRQAADLLFCISEPLHVLISVSSDPVCVCVCVLAVTLCVCSTASLLGYGEHVV